MLCAKTDDVCTQRVMTSGRCVFTQDINIASTHATDLVANHIGHRQTALPNISLPNIGPPVVEMCKVKRLTV